MILINSANFPLVDIDLSKDVFFLGDNASGKTTTTRAIHYLYNAEGRQLGIPSDKDSFEKYYFPYENSYIVYIFDDFFIMAFKRSGKIQKWFSKQPFDMQRVINENKLLDHDKIRAYIKEASSYRPQTNAEYRKIIYGQERRYLDFAIASIKNYDAFLEVYNMVFNVDKAIVDMKSIKKAIQKSLQKDDEILSLGFDQYIADMTAFKRDYDFFKKFDKQRDNIKKAVDMMEELVSLEQTMQHGLGKIRYNQEIDEEKVPQLELEYEIQVNSFKAIKSRWKHWDKRVESIENETKEQIDNLRFKIKELEALEEKYSPLNYEEALTLASKKIGLEKERDALVVSIDKLEEAQSSIAKEIDNRIQSLKRKIKEDIPAQSRQRLRGQKESEERQCDNDIQEIEAESEELLKGIEEKLESLNSLLSEEENAIDQLKNKYEKESEDLHQNYDDIVQKNSMEQRSIKEKISQKEVQLERLTRGVRKEEKVIRDYENVFVQERSKRAVKLNDERLYINNNIKEYQTLLSHESNSFKAFLADEVDGWEESIYPIIDKSLLSKSCDELKPSFDIQLSSGIFGVNMNLDTLETYPTAEELHERIVKLKEDHKILLNKAKDADREKQAEYDHFMSQAHLRISNINSEIKIEQDSIGALQVRLLELKQEYIQSQEQYKENKDQIKQKFEAQKNIHFKELNRIKKEIKTQKDEEKREQSNKKRQIGQRKKDLSFNIEVLKKQAQSQMQAEINEVKKEIKELEAQKHSKTEDEVLSDLRNQRDKKEEVLKECYRAEKFLDDYEMNREKIDTLHIVKKEFNRTENFLDSVKKVFDVKLEASKKQYEAMDEEHQKNNQNLRKLKDGFAKTKELNMDLSTIEKVEEDGALYELIDEYLSHERSYKNQRIDFKTLLNRLAGLEHNAIIDINLNLERFDEVDSIASLEHIKDSLDELYKFSAISYDNQKRSRHADFTNYLNNIIPQKLGTFNDLEDRFEQQKNRINRNLNKVDFGAIRQISLEMEKSKGNQNTIASLMRTLNNKVVSARTMFEDKASLFFDKPKSIENIDAIIDTLGKIKKQSEGGAIHIFDTIDLTISYVENSVKKKGLSHLKNDSSSGGNILLKVAITISILALFANKADKDTPFFLIVDEISRLKHQNQENLKKYINDHGFRTLFITPDPVYPDPKAAMYYMFRNSGNEKGGLEIAQMNII